MFSFTLRSQMLVKSGSFISKFLERYLHPTSFQNKFDIVCLMENPSSYQLALFPYWKSFSLTPSYADITRFSSSSNASSVALVLTSLSGGTFLVASSFLTDICSYVSDQWVLLLSLIQHFWLFFSRSFLCYDYLRQCTAVINYFIHMHFCERYVQNSHEHWKNSWKFISRNKEIFLFAKIYPVKCFWTSDSRSFIFWIFFNSYFLPTYK